MTLLERLQRARESLEWFPYSLQARLDFNAKEVAAVLNLIEAADRATNWSQPRIIPTEQCPDIFAAYRLLREAVAVFVSGQEEPR